MAPKTNPIELLFGASLQGPLRVDVTSSTTQFAGLTTIPQSAASATVSITNVTSDALIFYGVQGHASQTSGSALPIEVSTINPGSCFIFSTADGTPLSQERVIMWLMAWTS